MYTKAIAAGLLVLSQVLGFTAAQISCPVSYVPLDGTCIHFVAVTNTWLDAEAHCEEVGGHLVSLNDCHLFSVVVKYMNAHDLDFDDYWVGASDATEEGSWFWLNGDSVEMGSPFWGQTSSAYEPNEGTEGNCLAINRDDRYLFHDEECSLLLPSICQTNGTVTTAEEWVKETQ